MRTVARCQITADRVLAAFLTAGPNAALPLETSSDDILTPEQVAAWLKVKVATLATWRSEGRGPRACYMEGAVRYRRGTVANYIRKSEKTNALSARC